MLLTAVLPSTEERVRLGKLARLSADAEVENLLLWLDR
jgi:hypothetical protein